MDLFLFTTLNSLAGQSAMGDLSFIFLARYLAYILIAFVLAALVWPRVLGLESRIPALVASGAAVAAYLTKKGIVLFLNVPRPFDTFPEITQLIEHVSYESFPSGHTITFMALATALFLYNRTVGIIFGVAALFIGLGRVASGIHWPSDILGGASIGILVGVAVFFLVEYILNKTGFKT